MKRVALIVAAAIAGISLFLLASASANTAFFSANYPLILAINGTVAVALAGLVGVQLRRLYREYRARQFGSRLKYRLLLMFALMAITPGVVMYAVSLQFIVRSIETWFDVRVDQALEGGVALGQNALDHLQHQLAEKGAELAVELGEGGPLSAPRLDRLREQSGAATATLFSASGQVLVTASGTMDSLLPLQPTPAEFRYARQTQRFQAVEGEGSNGFVLRLIVPVPTSRLGLEAQFLQLTQPVPADLSRHASAVQEAYRNYQQLSLGRDGLKRIFTMTLSMTLLLALLAAVAVAILLTRRLAAPLLILAEGTQAVAQGDFSPRQALPARDELGVLTQSFNQMTRQLQDARAAAERNRSAVESARAYLESILANLSTGVLAFSPDGSLRAANRGATQILRDPLDDYENLRLAEWPAHAMLRDTIIAGFAGSDDDWHNQIEIVHPSGEVQTLLLHGARLPEASGGGAVVVFDDISRLIAAQRTAAWAEVARRLAHEIKNPLTPIQLSAERIAHKLADRLAEDDRRILERGTRTIVNQVEAMKNLVNAFRDYAKLPAPELRPLDLDELVREILTLYESSPVLIRYSAAAGLPLALGDPSLLRQVVHNLLQNAQDAVADKAEPRIDLHCQAEGEHLALLLRDNGDGFPADVLNRAFEPYFTTKSRGTGLGLAIVKKIIDEHGGDIRLANPEGGGAEVRLRLRICTPDHLQS